MVIGLLKRFSYFFFFFALFSSFKHDFHVDAESMIEREMMMMMSWSLTTYQPFWVISVIKVR